MSVRHKWMIRSMIEDGLINHGWNVNDLAKTAKVSKSAIRNMCHTKTCNPRIHTLVKVLDALNLEIDIHAKEMNKW